ncbi:MAG TPA: CHASE domain-containing protein [Limnobacter sp.]|nr:CHASE domain-containing protein [Limnobacter sp.]
MIKTSQHSIMTHSLLYLVLGALGLSLAISPGYSSPVFPAAGLALALRLRFGIRGAVAVFIGSFVLNLLVSNLKPGTLPNQFLLPLMIAIGSALQCSLGAFLVGRLLQPGWEYLDNERPIFQLMLVGGLLTCLCSATVGVGSMYFLDVIGIGEVPYSWWTWYAGDVLGVFLATPLFLLLFQASEHRDWTRFRSVGLTLAIAIVFAAGVFFAASKWESQNLADQVAKEGETIQRLLESRVIAHQEMLSSLNRLMEVNPDISQSQFDQFTRLTLQEQNDVFALSFNLIVSEAERTAFEAHTAKLLNNPDFQIRQRGPDGQLVRAEENRMHVPVVYISPLKDNQQAVGFDIYSDKLRRQAIQQSLDTGKGAVTAPIYLVQEQTKRTGVLLMQPIFDRGVRMDEQATALGFGVAVIKVDDMIRIALDNELNSALALRVADTRASREQDLFFQTHNWENETANQQYKWRSTIAVADREWQIELMPTAAYLEENRPLIAWGVGVLGMLFAALLQVMLLAVSGRTELVKRKVREQTLFIQEQKQRLEATSEQANAANLAKSRFLATMSHELRTPMNGILGIAKLIQLESVTPKQKERAEIILTSGEMLLNLLNDILDISKIEAGKIEIQAQLFSPELILKDIDRLYQAQAHHKDLSLQAEWIGTPPDACIGDPGRIRQILINLVSNALKFTPKGQVRVTGEVLERKEDGAHKLRFQVEDTGIGIAHNKLGNLFQPFAQLDDSYQRRHAGSGLGLSIAKNLAELMGGEVGVNSMLDSGSRFWFTVWVRLPRPDEDIKQFASRDSLARDNHILPQFRGEVFVVEDDSVNQTVIQAFLAKLGVVSEHAPDGISAVKRIKEGYRPDLILMDIQMPGLDGYEATREIRAHEQENSIPQIPIVALTAAAFPEERQRCFEAGMNDFLSKPVSLSELEQAIGQYLESKQKGPGS